MLESLITLPLRVGLRVTELALRGTAEVLRRAAGMAGASYEDGDRPVADPRSQASPQPHESSEAETETETEAETEAEAPAAPPEPEPVPDAAPEPTVSDAPLVDYDASEPADPPHVSEESELVEQVAEPGAEDGAGAQIRVDEPWEGYRSLRAADVIDRLGGASTAELAAIELYELSGRRRSTVIAAAQREFKRRD